MVYPMGATNMIRPYSDEQFEERITNLEVAVEEWARQNDLWQDISFRRVVKSFDMETGAPTVTTLCGEGYLADLVIYPGMGAIHADRESQRLSDECARIFDRHGFYGEPFDEGRLYVIPFEQGDTRVLEGFKEYMRWKWVCSLIQGDFDALNSELYAYFSQNSDQLTRLNWREFEMLVAELLEAQGFETNLGPGRADGGVDIRLLQRDPIGDALTFVQVKKHDARNPIRLQAVQALHGIKEAAGADNSMFVTTSRYLPSAKHFAGRENVNMSLYVSDDVRQWCIDANAGIIEAKERIVTEREVRKALNQARQDSKQVMHAQTGYTMLINKFSLVLKESAGSGLIMDLPSRVIEHDGYGQSGTEVPDLHNLQEILKRRDTVRRVKKPPRDSVFRFCDVDEEWEFYKKWNQEPARFYGD